MRDAVRLIQRPRDSILGNHLFLRSEWYSSEPGNAAVGAGADRY